LFSSSTSSKESIREAFNLRQFAVSHEPDVAFLLQFRPPSSSSDQTEPAFIFLVTSRVPWTPSAPSSPLVCFPPDVDRRFPPQVLVAGDAPVTPWCQLRHVLVPHSEARPRHHLAHPGSPQNIVPVSNQSSFPPWPFILELRVCILHLVAGPSLATIRPAAQW
jgi:hypothetical protein